MKNLNVMVTYNRRSTAFIIIGAIILAATIINVASYMLIYRFAEDPLLFTLMGTQVALVSLFLSGIFLFLVQAVHTRYRFLNHTLQ